MIAVVAPAAGNNGALAAAVIVVADDVVFAVANDVAVVVPIGFVDVDVVVVDDAFAANVESGTTPVDTHVFIILS